jgi:DNA ligase-1
MSIVKPPSFDDLVKHYGSRKTAILHLIQSGFTPELIEWKIGIPYHLIRLYMEGVELTCKNPFLKMVETYERLALLRSKKGKETELAKFFSQETPDLEIKVRLALGKLSDESLRIGPGIVEKAIGLATGTSLQRVRKLIIDYGEHGEVAYLLKQPKKAELTLEEVYEAIRLLPKLSKKNEREMLISSLLRESAPQEAKYIVRLLLGDLKLGYHQRTIINAIARAYGIPSALVENACALLGIAEGLIAVKNGEKFLSTLKLRPGQFIKPQLAHLYEPDKVVYPVQAEQKLDGSRLQIHKWNNKIWLFSRRGIEKSGTLPEVVEIAQQFKAQSAIIDSEVIATDSQGHFLPFQTLLERTVPSEVPPEELKEKIGKVKVTIRAFDILYFNGRELTELPLLERRKYLMEVVPASFIIEGKECQNEIELMKFYEETLKQGLEGIVIKSLTSKYEAGQRTYAWLKLKPERDTIDAVIVKALYGKGKRAGLYSSFLLAIRNSAQKRLYTIGRVSNLPENTMENLQSLIEQTKIRADDEGVFTKPSIIVEVTYQEIQETDEYTSGFALRVPKIVRFRNDKTINEIDTLEKLRKLFELQYDRHPLKTI